MGRKGPAIGIDLGTTCSCVGVFQNGKVEIIANDQSNSTTPSYVAFTETERLIGDAALNQVTVNPKNTIYDIKRVMGRKFKDLKVQQDLKYFPFTVVDDSGKPKIEVEFKGATKTFAPEEICSMLLMKMKETAETYLNCQITDAVISIPAHFNDSQRQATKDAATIAGINVLRLINDPTAAALSYAFNTNTKGKRHVLIFDLGGGTFDVSILTIDGSSSFEVKATAGDSHLGGEDFTNLLVNYLVEEFQRKYNQDISGNHKALRRLRIAAEKAKITLSSSTEATIEVDALDECTDFHTKISRIQFEELCADLFRSTIQFVEEVLSDAKISKNDIQDIVLVGGSTKVPKVQQLIQNFFGDKDLNFSTNSNEAVAYGAAIQAVVLSEDRSSAVQDFSLVDVTSLSLGIEAAGGVMVKLIDRNSRIPCKQTQTFTTFLDEQPSVVVKVYEGEQTKTTDNNCLGEFHLIGLPIARRGTPKIDVSFNLDANGILNVEAKEVSTGRSNNIVINKGRGRLSPEEIDRMVKKAEIYKAEEASQRERVAIKSELEDYLANVKQALDEADDKLPESEKDLFKQACEEVSSWLKSNTLAKKEEIEDKKLQVQRICAPFMSQVLGKGAGDDNVAKIEA